MKNRFQFFARNSDTLKGGHRAAIMGGSRFSLSPQRGEIKSKIKIKIKNEGGSNSGVALVVTLLMLSVITVVAVTFLALSRRERASVTKTTELTDARDMVNTAVERAKAQILAPIMATTNMLNGDIAVSRNFINPIGFVPGLSSFTNVNYDHLINTANPLSPADFLQNLTNLIYDPRPPVYVRTNRPGTPPASEFRFYIDLNRNGQFETNGFFFPFDDAGNQVGTNILFFVGDPEWIGVLEKPNLPHSANNRFIGRYAYIVVPVGRSLDLNFIHNQSQSNLLFNTPSPGHFFRNQGFGTYEINLAAFLAALNTNTLWFSNYYYLPNGVCGGEAFLDALDLVRYRYQGDYNGNDTIQAIFGANTPFITDSIDGLARPADFVPAMGLPDDLLLHAWPGANSRQHFYSIHDFFNRSKNPSYTNFIDRLTALLARTNSYDRYTFYRLLSQIGTDSAEEPVHADIPQLMRQISAQKPEEFLADTVGRININYDNVNYAASDFTNWNALTFFSNVANITIREQFPFGITNIPVSPTNPYPVAVQRLLQMSANIFDATTTDAFPSVFLPQVGKVKDPFTNTLISGISGYSPCTNRLTALQWAATNDYGLPAIVGVKKGLPNFNEYVFQTFFQIARKIELGRPNSNSLPNLTNQILIVGISNLFGVENWNSYSTSFTNNFQVYVSNYLGGVLYNAVDGCTTSVTNFSARDFAVLWSTNGGWRYRPNTPKGTNYNAGFFTPLYTNVPILATARYLAPGQSANGACGFDDLTNSFPKDGILPVADWRLIITNRFTYLMSSLPENPSAQDVSNGRVLDFVSFSFQTNLNLSEFLMMQDAVYPTVIAALWDTNRISNPATLLTPTEGIMRQIGISLGTLPVSPTEWNDFNGNLVAGKDKANSIAYFSGFMNVTNYPVTNLFQQTPFTASRRFVHTVTWQANDPLIHYMTADLGGTTNELRFVKPNEGFTNNLNLGRLNPVYQPWNGNPIKDTSDQSSSDPNPDDVYVGIKDPGVFGSDDWDFPSHKFPSIGWLGRVHRGTAWQTIYLKAEVVDGNRWLRRSADLRMHPTNDWRLLDLFTVAQTPNVSHGQLSINQSGVAAWTAVLGSISILSNTVPNIPSGGPTVIYSTNLLVDPVSHAAQIQAIVDSINRVRQRGPSQVFRTLGELMAVPELTTASPFINPGTDPSPVPFDPKAATTILTYGFNDEIYERIPRQILSLLKVGDARYVVYAFGQSLKPADKSIVTSAGNSQYFGMCTNYQITAEVYTRALLKVGGTARNPRPEILSFNILPAD